MEKCACVRQAAQCLCSWAAEINAVAGTPGAIGADYLLPLFAHLVVQAHLSHRWFSCYPFNKMIHSLTICFVTAYSELMFLTDWLPDGVMAGEVRCSFISKEIKLNLSSFSFCPVLT